MVSVSTSRDAPSVTVLSRYRIDKTLQRLGLVSAICVSCAWRYFAQILQATWIKWAKSAVAIMALLTRIGNMSNCQCITYWRKFRLILCIIITNGRENKVTTAIIITCMLYD